MAKGSSTTAVPPLPAALTGEFLGTALLILLGDGVVAGDVLLNKTSDKMMITTAWGLAVALAVYVCGRLSGGHINPAVTLSLAARGDFPRSRVLPYWGAQLAGAFVGALLVYVDYAEAFRAFEQNEHLVRGTMEGGKLVGTAAGGAGRVRDLPGLRRSLAEHPERIPGHGRAAAGRPGPDRPPERRPRAGTSSRWPSAAWSGRSACRWAA